MSFCIKEGSPKKKKNVNLFSYQSNMPTNTIILNMSSNGSGKLKAKNKKTAKFNFFARKNLLITIGTNKPYTAINLQILPIQKTHKHNPKKKQN